MFDILFRGGTVVDGTGDPGYPANVGIAGDRIEAVDAADDAEAVDVVNCDGLVVAPGFIDIHTHYDPQVLWDPELTPSSWHGVTTVLMGNCGFSLAPTRPEHRRTAIETLENVEGMSKAALEAGIAWEFETFAEYLDAVERRTPALNVSALVGHTAVRLYVMGDEAATRSATADEVAEMQRVLDSAIDDGAKGFANSKSPSHVGAGGFPVPSRLAENDEIYALADVLQGASGRLVQTLGGPDYGIPEFRVVAERSGRPVTWCSLHQGVQGGSHWELYQATLEAREAGVDLWAQMSCLPVVAQVTLEAPYLLESVPAFGSISGKPRPQRLAAFRDADWRARALDEMVANREGRTFEFAWDRIRLSESGEHTDAVGASLQELAEERGGTPVDALVDISLDDGLKARFDFVLFNYDEDVVGELLKQEAVVLGLSDAGAHASQLCDASYATYLLGHYVRERGDVSLEQAVWRLTGQPSEAFGFGRRGLVRPGYAADLCVFDPDRVDQGRPERVYDLPGGADRIIKRPSGIEHVVVNGRFIRRDGKQITGVGAGAVLR